MERNCERLPHTTRHVTTHITSLDMQGTRLQAGLGLRRRAGHRHTGGTETGTQKLVYQQWPAQIFPMVNFVFPTMVTLVRGGSRRGLVYGHSNTSLG